MNAKGLATFLGWFGIGLGLAQVLAPERIARIAGLDVSPSTMRAFGAREIASGIAILIDERPRDPVWGRVLGDAVDIAALVAGLRSPESDKARVTGALAAVGGVTSLDVLCAGGLTAAS